jgi:hypothetical protein
MTLTSSRECRRRDSSARAQGCREGGVPRRWIAVDGRRQWELTKAGVETGRESGWGLGSISLIVEPNLESLSPLHIILLIVLS